MTYDGPEGEEHDMSHRSTMTEPYFEGPVSGADADAAREAGEGRFFEILPLEDYPYGEVWLRPTFSHRTEAEAVIPIK